MRKGVRKAGKKGRVQERAEMVLRLLEWRGLAVTRAVREQVHACTDPDRLETWAQCAMHVTDAAELFAEE